MIAYACSPFKGSEPGLGWARALETAKYFDTTVICKKRWYEDDIQRYLMAHGEIPGLSFHFLGNTGFERALKKTPGFFYIAYNLWHRRAYRLALVLHAKQKFDLVHQANWVSFREPGYLWKIGLPFVWGPVGGTEQCPWRFLAHLGIGAALQEGCRNVINLLQFHLSPRLRQAASRATVLVAANSHGQQAFKDVHNIDAVRLLQVGTNFVVKAKTHRYDGKRPLRLLWSGRFSTNKGLPLLLVALSKLPSDFCCELRILGDGPLQEKWRRIAEHVGVEKQCDWKGVVPYDEAQAEFDWSDIYVFTSLRDAGATVVIEALSHGVPVICLDHSGARDVVTPDCGVKIPVTSPSEAIIGIRNSILELAGDAAQWGKLSSGALLRAREYLWERNGRTMAEIYRRALNATESDTGMG